MYEKLKKRLFKNCMLIIVMLLLVGMSSVYADAKKYNEFYNELEYAKEHYKNATLSMLQNDAIDDKVSIDEISLGNPFRIFKVDSLVQNDVTYFPIINNKESNIILYMAVINTEEGYTHSVSTEYVDEFNELERDLSKYIFYATDEGVCADDGKEQKVVLGKLDSKLESFARMSYVEKHLRVGNALIRNCNKERPKGKDFRYMYTPSFSVDTSSSKICSMNNKLKGQGNYNLCWAATVASIVNYRKGTNWSAYDVANLMGISFNSGASLQESYDALKKFGLTKYLKIKDEGSSLLTWNAYKNNINSKFPVWFGTYSSYLGGYHALTGYGYSIAAGEKYLIMWNSGENGGNGVTITVPYSASGFCYMYGLYPFVHISSISAK